MKKTLISLAGAAAGVVTLVWGTQVWSAKFTTHSPLEKRAEGYVTGIIEAVERRGIPRSTEVALHTGGVSGLVSIYKAGEVDKQHFANNDEKAKWEHDNYLQITPWHFSATKQEHAIIETYERRMTMTHYFQRRAKDPFLETDHEWVNTMELRQANFLPLVYPPLPQNTPWYLRAWEAPEGANNFDTSGGSSREGRIVNIYYTGSMVVKTWEAIVQWGDRQRSFEAMSIPNEKLARYAIIAMQSDAMLRIHYSRVYGLPVIEPAWRLFKQGTLIRFEESPADIFRIEQLPFPGTRPENLINVQEAIDNKKIDLDDYIQEHLGGQDNLSDYTS